MRFGCCTTYKNYRLVEEMGYDFIELPGFEVAAMTEEELSRFEEELKGGTIPCLGFNAITLGEPVIVGEAYDSGAAGEYVGLLAVRGDRLGIRSIGVGSPKGRILPDSFDRSLADRQIREFLRLAAAAAAPFGITVMLEALNKNFCNYINHTKEALEVVRELAIENLWMVLDFYHMVMAGEDPEDIGYVMPYARHLHVSGREGKTGRPFCGGKDLEELRRIFRAVKDWGYDDTVSVEAVAADISPARDCLEVMKRAWETA